MKKFLEEYGMVMLAVIVIGAMVAVAMIIKNKNDIFVRNEYSDFTDPNVENVGGSEIQNEHRDGYKENPEYLQNVDDDTTPNW
jgi:hypothetical protein